MEKDKACTYKIICKVNGVEKTVKCTGVPCLRDRIYEEPRMGIRRVAAESLNVAYTNVDPSSCNVVGDCKPKLR